ESLFLAESELATLGPTMKQKPTKKTLPSRGSSKKETSLLELPDAIRWAPPSWYQPWKVGFEFAAALLMGAVALPVIVLTALLVKLTSRGPALYSQTRVGRNGKSYRIYKLRTMRHNAEQHSGPCWSTAGDARITLLGRFLRRSHLDELPQLWNVIRGD